MSKHIPLPLERRGEKVYTRDTGLNRPTFICSCSTVEQAEEIITALEMHTPMMEALRDLLVQVEEGVDHTHPMRPAERQARAALTHPTKKATTP